MRPHGDCGHDVLWVVRTLAFQKSWAPLTLEEIRATPSANSKIRLDRQYDLRRITRALAHCVELGTIRRDPDGTFAWLGSAAR
jgi:hypothetical protein